MRPQPDSPKQLSPNGLRLSAPSLAPHLPTDACKSCPDLAAVVAAWPELPDAIKAGIVAMVEAASDRSL
jgi:hypothetical protein